MLADLIKLPKTGILILIAFVVLHPVTAQDYQPIQASRISYFSSSVDRIVTLRTDSVELLATDTAFYLSPSILETEYDCFSVNSGSWLGRKVILTENNEGIFYNYANRPFRILYQAALGEAWNAFSIADSYYVQAEIIAHDTMTFLGLADSVKTISLQAFNKDGDSLEMELNTFRIRLSKQYGFVSTLNFYYFPDHEGFYYGDFPAEYELCGLTPPTAGFQNLTWLEVYDFAPGDEIHILYEYSDWGGGSEGYSKTSKSITRFLERTDEPGTISYQVYRKSSEEVIREGSGHTFTFAEDTLPFLYNTDTLFDNSMPGISSVMDGNALAYKMTSGVRRTKIKPSVYDQFYQQNDSCWSNCCSDGCFPEYEYIEGLGGPYYQCDNAFSMGGTERKLVYYKKGEETWGTPLIVTSVPETSLSAPIKVFPNPASGEVQISFGEYRAGTCLFELSDATGRLVRSEPLAFEDATIDIRGQTPGLYFYRFIYEGKTIGAGKLAIR